MATRMEQGLKTPLYEMLRLWGRFLIDGIYYRKNLRIGKERVPADGTPLLVVSNHQNCLNDAFLVQTLMADRKLHFIARADAFTISPVLRRILVWSGVLPAFRMKYEGIDALENNEQTFRLSEQRLLQGRSLLIFPEAGHQDKHWLGRFSLGYVRLAFEAAAAGAYKKDIRILPVCNHYSSYFGMRNDALVRVGTPISLQPYYEEYQSRPRTVQREINRQVREQIEAMMLNISDLEHYDDIDFLRTSSFGEDFARRLGKDPARLPEKLEADRELVRRLSSLEEEAFTAVHAYRDALREAKVPDRQLAAPPSWLRLIGRLLLLLVTLPLAVVSLWPALPAWYIPRHFSRRSPDPMLEGTFLLAFNVLLIQPLAMLLTFAVTGLLLGWGIGLVHALLLPFLCIVAWDWFTLARRSRADFRFAYLSPRARKRLERLRSTAFGRAGKALEPDQDE